MAAHQRLRCLLRDVLIINRAGLTARLFLPGVCLVREPLPRVTPFLRLGGREWYLPAALRALSHRNYRLYWIGQLVSLTGTWMQSTAQQWLVYRLTGSPLKLGTVAFLASLPVMLFSLFAGVVIDRVDKRRLGKPIPGQSRLPVLQCRLVPGTFAENIVLRFISLPIQIKYVPKSSI